MLDRLHFLTNNSHLNSMAITPNPPTTGSPLWYPLGVIQDQQLLSHKCPHRPRMETGVQKIIKCTQEVPLHPPHPLCLTMILANRVVCHPCSRPHPSRISHPKKLQWPVHG